MAALGGDPDTVEVPARRGLGSSLLAGLVAGELRAERRGCRGRRSVGEN